MLVKLIHVLKFNNILQSVFSPCVEKLQTQTVRIETLQTLSFQKAACKMLVILTVFDTMAWLVNK